ncbi:hypothetical protein Tco_0386565 [Tanacetum coccineum]
MDDPNIIMEEYIRLEEVKAQRHGRTFNWKTARFRKVKYYEDEDDYFTDFETEFPAIVFDNTLTSDTALPCEPTISPPNENKIDYRLSLDKSDDEDYTVIFNEYLFSYKIISINDLKKDSENYEILKPSSSEPTFDYLDDLDYFNNFENEFPAIVYNDVLTSKPDLEIEPHVSSEHIDKFETSLSEYDEEKQSTLHFSNSFPLDEIFPNDPKTIEDSDDDIDIAQPYRYMAPLPHRDLRHPWIRYKVYGYDEGIIHRFGSEVEDGVYWGRGAAVSKSSDPERTYTTSITKTKAARYEIVRIEDMVPTLWSPTKVGVSVKKLHGYGHLEEIIVKRADRQLYKFKEGDYVDLHLNDIEDMLLLAVQHKLFYLTKSDIIDFIVALRMFTRSLVIKKRVEDLQLGVESYQKKLNITPPQQTILEIEFKELYTPSHKPPGVIYEDLTKQKRVMWADELYKFTDGTLKKVRDELHHKVRDFRLEYNTVMPRRKWTAIDRKRSKLMIKLIDKQMRERMIIQNLERLVGTRELEMDYKLMTRTV